MSIQLMTAAWRYPDLSPGQKLVLLALCDNASDEGLCFPSVTTIAEKCSMGLRTVQSHLNYFEEIGLLARHERPGRSTIYMLEVRKIRTPAESAPPQFLHKTPADFAPITIIEPSSNKTDKGKASKRCPETFEISDDLTAWATEKAPLVDVASETEAFRDYEFAKARSDWKATWRTWMRRAQEQRQRMAQRQQLPVRRNQPPERDFSKIDYGTEGLI